MRPIQEQDWSYDSLAMEVVSGGRTIATLANISDEDAVALGSAMAATPDLAQALLAHGQFETERNGDGVVWHTTDCWRMNRAVCTAECERDRDALGKAGIL